MNGHSKTISHLILQLLLLICLTEINGNAIVSRQVRFWRCKGKESLLSDTACTLRSQTGSGCYYDRGWGYFRSCRRHCNDVRSSSHAEMTCRSYCPGYLESYCKSEAVTTPPPSTTSTTAKNIVVFVQETTTSPCTNDGMSEQSLAITISVVVIVPALLALALVCLLRKTRLSTCQRNNGEPSHIKPTAPHLEEMVPVHPCECDAASIYDKEEEAEGKQNLTNQYISFLPSKE